MPRQPTEGQPVRPQPEAVAHVLESAGRAMGTTLRVDEWLPSVQGAVGHVLGVCDGDGSRYVLKVYGAALGRRAATEALALRLLGDVPGVPVPQLFFTGDVRDAAPAGPLFFLVMGRCPGVRWADRRDELDASQSSMLHRDVGQLLRVMHVLPGDWFGDLVAGGPAWTSAWSRVDARCDALVRQHRDSEGPAEIGHRVRCLVDAHREAFASCRHPVLCHNDFIGGNLLVRETGSPHVCGVVDLERASWDDPLTDLARTRLHAWHHDPATPDLVSDAYGVHGDHEWQRIAVHEVLHALEERTWVVGDRPAGWERSVARLDGYLDARTPLTGRR